MRPSYDSISQQSESYESDQSRSRLIPSSTSDEAEDPETGKSGNGGNGGIDQENIAPYEVKLQMLKILKYLREHFVCLFRPSAQYILQYLIFNGLYNSNFIFN